MSQPISTTPRADAITPSGRLRFIQWEGAARLQQEWYCVGGTGSDWFDVPIVEVPRMPPRREP